MKFSLNHRAAAVLAAVALLFGAARGHAQILLKVDSTKPWQGYVNVFELPANGGAYLWGSPWGLPDLVAFFTGTNSLTLMPNTNTYNPADPYWVNPDGTGNKSLEANFYVENTALRGQTATFDLTVLSNNLFGATGGHITRAFIKTLDSGAGYTLVPGAYEFVELTNSATPYAISITVSIPSGATMIPQYGFVTTGPNLNPAWSATNGLVRLAVNNADPSITGQPAGRRVQVGDTVTFTVAATGGSTLSYQWKRYGTNLLNGGNISGANGTTLTLTGAQLADATVYTATVTDAAGSLDSNPAVLRVKTAAEFANALDNPGFEDPVLDPVTLIPTPWNLFGSAGLRDTTMNYAFQEGSPIQTVDGTNAAYGNNGGEWNGAFQDVAAAPGDIFTADASFYVSDLEQLFGDITVWLEVQFRGGGLIHFYKSDIITETSPMNAWISLSATNGIANDYVTPIGTARYLVAPPGTTSIRYQVTVHTLAGSAGIVNYDGMLLMKKYPVSLSASLSGGSIDISWISQAATSYQVVYKDDLGAAGWTPVGGTVAGDGTVKTASFSVAPGNRFYAVLTL